MKPSDAARIATLTAGRKRCEGCAGQWYLTDDPDDNSSGVTFATPGAAIADMLRRVGVLIVPSDMELPGVAHTLAGDDAAPEEG